MITITIPNNNINEREYILNILFSEFLGLEYNLEIGSKDYDITLENGKKLIIEDTFFNKYPKDLEYLKLENIPNKIEELDIFSASFFMLTRWEEYVNRDRDNHNRFPAYESLAFKEGFLDRPIVNEYLEELKAMLLDIDESLVFKKREYKLILTHDVDSTLKYRTIQDGVKEIVGDIVKRKDLKKAFENIMLKIKVMLKLEKDPYDTFDFLMDISEDIGVKSYFFFMGKGVSKFDNMYSSNDKFLINLVNKIKKRGHHIGIHATYNAYNDFEQFKKEKDELEKNLNLKVLYGREHFLRFEVPTTWQVWEDNAMSWDSTLCYADREGFRCGVCYEYSLFNILSRKKLNLKERPLIVMEGSFATYQEDIEPNEMEKKIVYLMNQVKKYNGEFVFLWHNSSFNTKLWKKYQYIYEKVVKS